MTSVRIGGITSYAEDEEQLAAVLHAYLCRYVSVPSPDYADIREAIRAHVRRVTRGARLKEVMHALDEEAQRKGRELYLRNRAFELQREIDEASRQIAEKFPL